MTPTDSVSLTAQTSLRAGDEFSIRVNGGTLRKIVIGENDTLTTLGDKLRKFANTRVANIMTWSKDGGRALRIDVKAGNRIELIAGAEGKDALAKLGLEPRRLVAPPAKGDNVPKVTPGGSFGLDLSDVIQVGSKDDAKIALKQVEQAISFTQSAYRSLYWDDVKAAMADDKPKGRRTGASTAIQQAQRANYEAALNRLSGGGGTISYGF